MRLKSCPAPESFVCSSRDCPATFAVEKLDPFIGLLTVVSLLRSHDAQLPLRPEAPPQAHLRWTNAGRAGCKTDRSASGLVVTALFISLLNY
jgi:hypothetical protein